ncbi:helix-turn-helix domain-containing protein [uncultured Sulfitobacter sp.]
MGDPGHHEALLSPLLTADDLARWLGCVPATVRSYAREGLLKPIRLGSTIRFRLSDVSSLLGDV